MKKLIILLCLFSLSKTLAQQECNLKNEKNINGFTITSISYMADSIEELETINWIDVKEMFDENKNNEKIELTFGLDFKKSKNNFKSSIKIAGESKDLDSLIIKSKKLVRSLIKISKNYQK
ncbi:MAG: hypothetical protein P8P88_03515 [Polaribacter sp.]|nr:hypothetical protein [Polaribacter sp.]